MTVAAPRTSTFARDALLVALLAVAGHWAALHDTGFTIDDHEIVAHNPRLVVRGWADLPPLVTTNYWGELYPEERLWRPTTLVSLALDRTLLGPAPDGFHRVGVALHALTSVLLLALLRRVVPGRRAALLGALVFALHPVHAEATAGVVGRAEVLALLFAVVAMLLHLRRRDAPDAPGAGGVALDAARALPAAAVLLLAFGSKEIALTTPAVLALFEVARAGPAGRLRGLRALAPYATYLAAIGVYFVARGAVLGEVFPTAKAQSIGGLPLHDRVLVAAEVARDSAAALLVPRPTASWYPFAPPSWSDPRVLATAAVNVLLLGWGFVTLRRGAPAARALALGVVAFFVALGPVSNLIPIGVVRADRLLYTPSAWFCLAAAAAAAWASSRLPARLRRTAWTALAALTLFPCAPLLARNARAWVDERRLRQETAARFPGWPQPMYLLGEHLLGEHDPQAALPLLEEAARRIDPGAKLAPTIRSAHGLALHRLGRSPEALAVLAETCAAYPTHVASLTLLASVSSDLASTSTDPGERARLLGIAERACRDGVRQDPSSYVLWLTWGTVLTYLDGRDAEARAAFDRAVEQRSDPWEALFNRSRLKRAAGDRAGALEDLRRCTDTLLASPHLLGGADVRVVLPDAMLDRAALARVEGRAAESEECLRWLRAALGEEGLARLIAARTGRAP